MDNIFLLKCKKKKKQKSYMILIITLLLLIKFACSNNKFYIYSNSFKKNVTENIEILDVLDYNKHIDDNFKLIFAETFDNFKEKFNNITNVKNIKLGVLVPDASVLNHIKYAIMFSPKIRNAVNIFIINESFILKDVLIINIYDHQILKAKDSDFYDIVKLNFFDEKNDISAFITYDDKTQLRINPYLEYMYFCVYTGIALSIIVSFIWHQLTFKVYRDEASSLQKILLALPFLQIFYFFSLYIYIQSITKKDDPEKSSDIWALIYLDTFFLAFKYLYKTIFWFIIIMINYGWQIYRFSLQREELRKFIGLYILIYILVCPDQIMDSIFPNRFLVFKFSEIKNIFIYLILLAASIRLFLISYKILNRKLYYARVFASNFILEFKIKKTLLLTHFIITLLYIFFYTIQVIVMKYVINPNDAEKILQINNNLNDFLFMILYLINLRPRKLPNFYYLNIEDLESQEENLMNMYLVNTGKLKEMQRNDYFYKNNFFGFLIGPSNYMKKKIYRNKELYPILIINPIFPENNNNESIISEDLESNRFSHSINNQNKDAPINNVHPINNLADSTTLISKAEPALNVNGISLNEKFCLGYID